MAIANIVDRRTNPHRWKKITATSEPTWRDNGPNSDQALRRPSEGIGYVEFPETSVWCAIDEVNKLPGLWTIYLYDLGEGIRVEK